VFSRGYRMTRNIIHFPIERTKDGRELQERIQRIRESLDRIYQLMKQLKDIQDERNQTRPGEDRPILNP
jgi:hypothetical protein